MDLGKIPMVAVGAAIAIVILTVVAVPIFSEMSNQISTSEQNATQWFSMAAENDVTIEFGEGGVYKLNGVQVDNPPSINWSEKCFSPQIMIKFNGSSNVANAVLADKTRIGNITKAVYSNGSLEITTTTSTTTIDVDFFYYMDPNGTWGLFQGNALPVHINNGQEYYVICQSSIVTGTGEYVSAFLYKNNERTSTVFNPIFTDTYNGTFTDATVDVTMTVDQVDSKHFDVTDITNPVVNGNVTFSKSSFYIMAPLEYQMITQNDSAVITIIDVIPILLIVVLLMGIVAAAFTGRI